MSDATRDVELSVVFPVYDEEGSLRALLAEVEPIVRGITEDYEIVFVDDGSKDGSSAILDEMRRTNPRVVVWRLDRNHGISSALHCGFTRARGRVIATLDADLQNDPADIAAMFELMRTTKADMVQGDRSHARKDNAIRKITSVIGRVFRRNLLGDTIRDTGCSLRLMKREIAVQLPLQFRGMHRFIPVTARHMGYTVVEMRVNHRPRTAGETKYGMGIVQRAIPGLIDLFAVRYMRSRRRPTDHAEVRGPGNPPEAAASSNPVAAVTIRRPVPAQEIGSR